jgi:cytochrome b involved in lipid metabolism
MDNIQYLLHHQIDKLKWDACINNATNGLLYASSGYLDSMANHWDALILNDYEIVMPLPHRKKFGINYLFQPSITPALGIMGNAVTPAIIGAFLKNIPPTFKVWDLSFNSSNTILYSRGTVVVRKNYVLNLNNGYSQIRKNYSENINRNINNAIKNGCVLKKDISFSEVAEICKIEFPKFTTVEEGLFEKLHNVYKTCKTNSKNYGVFTKEGVLLASCIFLFFKNRAYYWLVGNTPQSKEYGASSLLIDSFIKDHAGNNLLLDFEGSDTKSVADFYKKFGASLEAYTTLYVNKLPFPFNLLKPLPEHYRSLISK